MMESARETLMRAFQTEWDNPNDNRLFSTFTCMPGEKEVLDTAGIDGVMSEIITFKSLQKLLSLMGLEFFRDAKRITADNILYTTLRTRFECQKNFYVGRSRETVFARLPLGESHHSSLRNCLFIVFNSKELREKCVKNKKGFMFYCKISLQGLHQPTRELGGKMMECFHLLFKRVKLGELDIAIDVKKRGKIIQHAEKIKQVTQELLETDVKITTPKFVADVEKSCYFNVLNRLHPVKNIKFYNKYKKQTEKYEEKLNPIYNRWHRIEITLRNLNGKFKSCADKVLLCFGRLLEILKKSDIMPRVKISLDSMELLKTQMKAIQDMKFSKKVCFLPDYDLYSGEEKEKIRKNNTYLMKNPGSYIMNKIIPTL